MTTTVPDPNPGEEPKGGAGQEAQGAPGGGEQRPEAGKPGDMREARQGWAKQSSSLKEMVGKAMGRWGGGVPDSLRAQVTGAARFDKFTERAKKVLELAAEEARRMNHNYIGTEHVLLGLVREGEGVAAGVLESMGATSDLVRSKVIEMVAATPGGATAPGPKDN